MARDSQTWPKASGAVRPARPMPWWRAIPLGAFIFGIHAAILAYFPSFDSEAANVGGILALVGFAVFVLGTARKHWITHISYVNLVMVMWLGIAYRGWKDLYPNAGLALAPLITLSLLAWAMPWLAPKVSSRVAREQLAPTTSLGRGIETVALAFLPAAAASAYV